MIPTLRRPSLRHVAALLVGISGGVACEDRATSPTDTATTPPVVEPADPVVVVQGPPWVQAGTTATFQAVLHNTVGESVTWASSDPSVLTIDAEGLATGIRPGAVTVTATTAGEDGEVSGSLDVVVDTQVPNFEAWLGSAHADYGAEAFTHWNEDGEVPTTCARCHTSTGFQDFLGADGTDPGVVDAAAPIGQGIDCQACHNTGADVLDAVAQ